MAASNPALQYIVLTEAIVSTIVRVELRQLRGVEAVSRHRHFTRAAEELHVAQSALSHQIQRLELELGTPLFERTSRRVPPNRGRVRRFAARARNVLAEVDAAREEVEEASRRRR